MAAVIRRSRLARRDYVDIWRYIAEHNPDAADRLLRTIDAKLAVYAELPDIGTNRDSWRPGLRSFPVGRYLVFYRAVADGIELVRVLHGARGNLRSQLGQK